MITFNSGLSNEISFSKALKYYALERLTIDYSHGSLEECWNPAEAVQIYDLRTYYDQTVAAGVTRKEFPVFRSSNTVTSIIVRLQSGVWYISWEYDSNNIFYWNDGDTVPDLRAAFVYYYDWPPEADESNWYTQFYILPYTVNRASMSVHAAPASYGGEDILWFYDTGLIHTNLPALPVFEHGGTYNYRTAYHDPSFYNWAPEYAGHYEFSPNPINRHPDTYKNIDGSDPDEENPEPPTDDPFDPSTPHEYDPVVDDTSDTITIPSDPTIGVTKAGFINVYKPGPNALTNLGSILFPNVASSTDVVQAVFTLCETIANQNLINYVIDCHVIPVTPVTGANDTIKVGFRDTNISVPKVTSDYVNVSCGALNILEYFGSYADYAATRSKIYLPFIGFVDTLPEFFQSGTISIDYKFNVIDGSFMAYIRSSSSKSQLRNTVIAQYGGNACMHFPITGVNYANMASGLVGAAVSAASGGTSSAVLGSALSAANTIAQGGNVQQSNGYNSTSGMLGVRTPYLQIERAVPSWATNYPHDKGLPSNITAVLNNVHGYTIIDDMDLSGIPLTQSELEELRGLLKEGVYF